MLLQEWHELIQQKLQERGIHVLSYNVDGASIERSLTHSIQDAAVASGRVRTWSFPHPQATQPPLILQCPILDNGLPCIMSEDGKHARKNARGSATSGARILTLGAYTVHVGQFVRIMETEGSPILKTDFLGGDKQDDRASARALSPALVIHVIRTQPHALGLIIYVFVMGDIIDAQQNRKLSHAERMHMLWRGLFFLEGWRKFILCHPFYSIDTHFITRQLYDVLRIFITAMLMLILAHCDHFPGVPLVLHLHSTETCEHVFGCARKCQAEFTFADWIMMGPKLSLLMSGEMYSKLKSTQADASTGRAGYHHTWFDSKDVDLVQLATFPSDQQVTSIIRAAHYEASALLRILDMESVTETLGSEGAYLDKRAFFESLPSIHLANEDEDGLESGDEDEDEASPAERLENLLRADMFELDDETRTSEVDDKMTSLGIAATAAAIHDTLHL